MTSKDPRPDYLRNVELSRSKVQFSPPIVFLFGGTTAGQPPNSVRGQLYNFLLANKPQVFPYLVMPENFPDWLNDSVYPDLLTFEEDLAQTSTLVVIALESPGSIAELGAFSVNSDLKHKVVILMSEHHHNQDSFIKLGPVRQLRKPNVYAIPFEPDNVAGTVGQHLPAIADAIEESLEKCEKSQSFSTRRDGHIALLVYELVRIFGALKIEEIRDYLEVLSAPRKRKVVKRLLFLLQKLELIEVRRYLNLDYYFTRKTEQRVQFTVATGAPMFDFLSASLGTKDYYQRADNEVNRRRVIDLVADEGEVT